MLIDNLRVNPQPFPIEVEIFDSRSRVGRCKFKLYLQHVEAVGLIIRIGCNFRARLRGKIGATLNPVSVSGREYVLTS